MVRETCSRRNALVGLGSLAAGPSCHNARTRTAAPEPGPTKAKKVVAFDAFPIFDPRPIQERLTRQLGAASAAFLEKWRSRQFEYTWWLAAAGGYLDFWEVTLRSLRFANANSGSPLSEEAMLEVAKIFFHLPAWPDAKRALHALERRGYQLALLSNFTPKMLRDCLRSAGLEDTSMAILSADLAHSFKPSPKVYRLATRHFHVSKDEVIFVAFAPWDALGASWFGYETVWVNRGSLAREELEPRLPQVHSLEELVAFLSSR